MRTTLAALVALGAAVAVSGAASSTAAAENLPVAVVPHEADVVVYVVGARLGATPPAAKNDWVLIDLQSAPAEIAIKADDPTLKRVEVSAGAAARVSLQLRHGSHTTSRIARAVFVEQTAGGVRIVVPRKEALAATPAPAPATTATAAPAPAPPAPPAPRSPSASAVPAAATASPATGAAPADGPAHTPEPVASATPAPRSGLPTAATTTPPLAGAPRGGGGALATLAAGALLVAGAAGAFWLRRRRPAPGEAQLSILASRALGGKARLVLVGAHGREILLAVSDRGAKVLSDWSSHATGPAAASSVPPASRGGATPASGGATGAPGGGPPSGGAEPTGLAAASGGAAASPAVAGILRLKLGEHRAEPSADDLDSEWARAILAAARRGEPS